MALRQVLWLKIKICVIQNFISGFPFSQYFVVLLQTSRSANSSKFTQIVIHLQKQLRKHLGKRRTKAFLNIYQKPWVFSKTRGKLISLSRKGFTCQFSRGDAITRFVSAISACHFRTCWSLDQLWILQVRQATFKYRQVVQSKTTKTPSSGPPRCRKAYSFLILSWKSASWPMLFLTSCYSTSSSRHLTLWKF